MKQPKMHSSYFLLTKKQKHTKKNKWNTHAKKKKTYKKINQIKNKKNVKIQKKKNI